MSSTGDGDDTSTGTSAPGPGATAEPVAPRRPHTWDRPGGPVDDPWAWLADRDDPATTSYLEAENAHTAAWFAEPERSRLVESIYEEIRSRVQETDMSVPTPHGGWFYVTRTAQGASYPVFCRGRSAETAGDTVLLDANHEAEGHEFFALHAFEPSPAHDRAAWAADTTGDEQCRLLVRDLATGDDHDGIDEVAPGGLAWSADGSWLFYLRSDDQMRPHEVWRHKLGSRADDDVCVHRDDDQRFYLSVESSRSEAWIIITAESQQSCEVLLIDAARPEETPRVVRPRVDGLEYYVDHWGDRFVVLTNDEAPDFRIMTAPIDDPDDWRELIGHEAGRRIVGAEPFADHLVVHEWCDAQQRLRVVQRDGSELAIDTGSEPHEVEFGPNLEWKTSALRYRSQSLTLPPTMFEQDVVAGGRVTLKQAPTPNVDLDGYVSTRTWAAASDGTSIPVDVVHHVDTPVDGSAPCVLYGYGAYEVSLPPWFSVARLSLLDRGFVWALAHPRGGGELGRSWYEAGRLLDKRNTFTDTLAVAHHLIDQRWADPGRLSIRGGSAGGLLVGACVTTEPELFATAVAEVPFVDVVTTMSDPSLPLTVTEWEEWGDPREEPYASYIASYSPYDQSAPVAYPAMYITGGLNDIRVSYHEPAKWTAKLRAVRINHHRPLLFHCEMGAGHSGPSGRYNAWRDEAKTLAFLVDATP